MALAFSNQTSGYSTNSEDTTASVTVPANSVVYLTVIGTTAFENWTANTRWVSVAGLSLTWTTVAEQVYGSRRKLYVFRAINTGSEASGTITITYNQTTGTLNFGAIAWSVDLVTGINTSTPNDTPVYSAVATQTSIESSDVGAPDTGDAIFVAYGFESTGDSFTIDAALTALGSVTGETAHIRQLHTGYDATAPLEETPGASWSTGGNGCGMIAFIVNSDGVSVELDQYAFRFGLDDGNESSHGWIAAQNTDITRELDTATLLRVIVNNA